MYTSIYSKGFNLSLIFHINVFFSIMLYILHFCVFVWPVYRNEIVCKAHGHSPARHDSGSALCTNLAYFRVYSPR